MKAVYIMRNTCNYYFNNTAAAVDTEDQTFCSETTLLHNYVIFYKMYAIKIRTILIQHKYESSKISVDF